MENQVWDSLLLSRSILTMEAKHDYGEINNGAIGIKDGHIAWIGSQTELSQPYSQLANTIIDYGHHFLSPALIDCHTHLIYGGQRANEFALRLAGKTYAEIALAGGGINATVHATRTASDDDLFRIASQRLLNLQREGVGCVEIKSGYGLDTDTELRLLRIARSLQDHSQIKIITTYLGAHALPPEYPSADEYIDFICREILPKIATEHLADAVDVFCEHIGFTLMQTEQVFKTARRLGLAIKCHAEQLSDIGASQLAAKYQALSVDHLEFLSEAGVKAIAQSGTVAVLLPGAFYMLQETQKPPIALLRKHQVPMAIATDMNPGTSPVGSLLLMLNMACIFFGLTPYEALAGVTKHAAKALGLEKTHGTLQPGKVADIAVWDIKDPAELAYYIGFNPCIQLIKAGKKICN
jgi:imidazolonepropionase